MQAAQLLKQGHSKAEVARPLSAHCWPVNRRAKA
jgi:hypothetical protein